MPYTNPPIPHPKSVDGPFYVEDKCCMTCGIPLDRAPRNFAWDDEEDTTSCYVSRQPADAAELEAVLRAMGSQEVDCVRYRGADLDVLTRLAENDMAELCDIPPPAGARPLIRDRVTFRPAGDATARPKDAAADFVRHLRTRDTDRSTPMKIHRPWSPPGAVSVRVSWYANRFHTIRFATTADGQLLASHNASAGHAISLFLHDWLTASGRFTDIGWRTRAQYAAGEPGQALPM